MNRDRLEGHWKQTKGRARKSAGRWNGTPRVTLVRPVASAASRDWHAGPAARRPAREQPAR